MSAARLLKGNGRFTPCTCSRLSSSSVKCASAYSAPTAPAAGDPASGPFGYGRGRLHNCSWVPFMLFFSFSPLGHSPRSEERRVGKEGRTRGLAYH